MIGVLSVCSSEFYILGTQALTFKKYSTSSDVWSYGVLMYEIWSLGRKPFQKYCNEEVCFNTSAD